MKQERIKQIIERAEQELRECGVEYFLTALDRNEKVVHAAHEMKKDGMFFVLQAAFPTHKDAAMLGIWAGQHIKSFSKKSGK